MAAGIGRRRGVVEAFTLDVGIADGEIVSLSHYRAAL